MRTPRLVAACVVLALSAGACAQTPRAAAIPVVDPAPVGPAWPEITRDNKPWTRWWWPGSAVDRASLTRQLEQLAAAGVGGVEITPIYGAKGYESRYIDFLSPKWMEMLEHTGREAKRLGLGVDMATGTGWPFGGPWIDEANALTRATLKDGQIVGEPTKMMVKRAAPGDEGLVVDPYSPDALRRYLAPFDRAFAQFPRELIRGQFHDSFEYFNASWTAKLPDVFRAMHGYDLQTFAAALITRRGDPAPAVDPDTLARVKSDFRATLARLHLDYLRTWIDWSHQHGWLVRNQSHGAPANLLDLYGAVDVPETEIFGSTPFPIPGLRRNREDTRTDSEQDLPESLVVRVASSAAHVMGKPFASSESATWLRDHWKESLAYVKPELDRILCDGINHIFYHGTVFSPQDAAWPGWLFYASTQFNPNNPWWEDFGALNGYVARVQSILQRGIPDNDILLYWPFADVLDDPNGLMKMFGVHDVKWMTDQPVGKIARKLMERGYAFDYVSDAQLEQTRTEASTLLTPGGTRYRILVVPATRRMPVATLRKLAELARAGAIVVFEKLPEDVPGYGQLASRRAEFKAALGTLGDRVTVQADVLAALSARQIPREPIAETGLSFLRRASAAGADYFLSNLTAKPFAGWTTLSAPAQTVALLDPLTGGNGAAAVRTTNGGERQIYLQLAPGESLLVRTSTTRPANAAPNATPLERAAAAEKLHSAEERLTELKMIQAAAARPWPYRETSGEPIALHGTWSITFTHGGPELPPALTTRELKSWTDLGGDDVKRFAGTARYRLEFDAPAVKADDWLLDLGDVRESARVRVNGRAVTTAWSIPFRVRVGEFLRPGRNVLELDVTNLAANRIRDLDQRKVDWKIMREINFVNINYKPFDASAWPLTASGLLGPVTLTPLRALNPAAAP